MAPDLNCYTTQGNDLLTDCALADMASAFGSTELFGLFVGGTAVFVLWQASGQRIGVPATFLILGGGFLLGALPAQYVGFARSLMILGLAAALWAVAKRYVLSPGVS